MSRIRVKTVRCEHCQGRGWNPPPGKTVEDVKAEQRAALAVPTEGMAARLAARQDTAPDSAA